MVTPSLPPNLVVLDCETTGLDPTRERVVEIGVVRLGPDLEPVERFCTLVDPRRTLPLAVARLTGITQPELDAAPTFDEIWPTLTAFVTDSLIVGHNVGFDLSFLAEEAARCGGVPIDNGSFDTLDAALLLCPELDHHGLDALAAELRLTTPTHRALRDAEATAQLLARLVRRAAELPAPERTLLEGSAWPPLQTLRRLRSVPSGEPPAPAPDSPADMEPPVLQADQNGWRACLGPAGKLADELPGYRSRTGQLEFAESVAAVLETGGVGLFEAGTGMGKSVGYLLPAAYIAAATGRRIVVSTKTKALQRQLAERELPLVERLAPVGWRWAVLMGRENYLCRRQLDEAISDAGARLSDRDRVLALAYLVGRARRGEVDLSSLPYRATQVLPALQEVGREVRSSSAGCLRRSCPARARCYWRLARARASAAHLVCVNHALLLAGPTSVPAFELAIIDEAHLLPDEAQAAFSRQVTRALLDELLRDLRGRRRQRSLAARLRAAVGGVGADEAEALAQAIDELERATAALDLHSVALGASVAGLLAVAGDAAAEDTGYSRTLWLRAGLREAPAWDAFAAACADAAATLSTLGLAARAAAESLPDDHRETGAVRSVAEVALPAAELLDELPELARPETVYWAQIDAPRSLPPRRSTPHASGADGWLLEATPLSPASGLRASLWEKLRGAALVSATLTASSSFAYYRRQTGLTGDVEVAERALPSPFDYRRQAVLVLEHDPARPYDSEEVPARQAARLRRLVEVTGGRLLALFTNRRQMEHAATAVGPHVEEGGVLLLAQGLHGSAAALAEEFRSHPSTVLLGVDALWTGQDFPGDTLVCLVIAKLPFPRQDPLFEARRQAAEDAGEDWFRAFYLPEAILRFRQGFGRLIRTEDDRGVVAVLDHRLTQKAYGREFLNSLPEMEIVAAAPDALAAVVGAHLSRLGALPSDRA
jgi:DNA polymerase III epsilon subunit family exonuclease